MERTLLQLNSFASINLRAYAQKDPLNEYKREAHMFDTMLNSMRQTVTMALSHVELRQPDAEQAEPEAGLPLLLQGRTAKCPECPLPMRFGEEI